MRGPSWPWRRNLRATAAFLRLKESLRDYRRSNRAVDRRHRCPCQGDPHACERMTAARGELVERARQLQERSNERPTWADFKPELSGDAQYDILREQAAFPTMRTLSVTPRSASLSGCSRVGRRRYVPRGPRRGRRPTMPANSAAPTTRPARAYGLRWYDESGARRRRAGFSSSRLRKWFADVEQPRMRGDDGGTAAGHAARACRPLARRPRGDPRSETQSDTAGAAARAARGVRRHPTPRPRTDGSRHCCVAGDLPQRSRYGIVSALRQCLEAAVRWGDMSANPAKLCGAEPAASTARRADVHDGRG